MKSCLRLTEEEVQRVTKDGVLYQMSLSSEDVLSFSAWQVASVVGGGLGPARCFLWCGSPETVPEPQVSPAEVEVIENLVRRKLRREIIKQSSSWSL